MKIDQLDVLKSELTDEYYIANPNRTSEKKNVTKTINYFLKKETEKDKKLIAVLVEELYGVASTKEVLKILFDAGMTEEEVKETNAFASEAVEKYYKGV